MFSITFLSSTSILGEEKKEKKKKAKTNLEVKEANIVLHSKRKWFKHFKSELKGNKISVF